MTSRHMLLQSQDLDHHLTSVLAHLKCFSSISWHVHDDETCSHTAHPPLAIAVLLHLSNMLGKMRVVAVLVIR